MPDGAYDILRQQFGGRPFRVAEAIDAGVSRTTIQRLRDAGTLVALSRGIVQLPNAGMGMHSGLAFWDLTDEIPDVIHLAVPRGAHRPSIHEPPVRVHVFDADTFDIERLQAMTDADEPFWIYSPERTVVDAMRMSRWVGRDVALHALRRYTSKRGAQPARLAELARQIGGGGRIAPALEALLS